MEGLFDKISKDLKNGIGQGIAVLKEGANVVSVKMNELSEEGKRQYKIFNLSLKIQDQIKELGEMVYDALDGMKSLDENKKIKAAFTNIKKLEWQLSKIEGSKKIKTVSAIRPAAKEKNRSGKNSETLAKKTVKKTADDSRAPK